MRWTHSYGEYRRRAQFLFHLPLPLLTHQTESPCYNANREHSPSLALRSLLHYRLIRKPFCASRRTQTGTITSSHFHPFLIARESYWSYQRIAAISQLGDKGNARHLQFGHGFLFFTVQQTQDVMGFGLSCLVQISLLNYYADIRSICSKNAVRVGFPITDTFCSTLIGLWVS